MARAGCIKYVALSPKASAVYRLSGEVLWARWRDRVLLSGRCADDASPLEGGGDVVIALPRFARPLLLLRGIILFRTYDGHKNEVFPHFLHTEFGSDYYVPP